MIEDHPERRDPARDALTYERRLVAVPDRGSDRILRERGKLARLRSDTLDREEAREVGRVFSEGPIFAFTVTGVITRHFRMPRRSGRVDGRGESGRERDIAIPSESARQEPRRYHAIASRPELGRVTTDRSR